MSTLVIHTTTQKHIGRMAARPAHALLLLGPDGVGKGSIANLLSARLLDVDASKLASYPYIKTLQPVNGTLSIDAVREAQKFLQLKTTGTARIRRIICLEHADHMTPEAQNALLKILEEPPADTVVILTAQHKRALLPTILSRVQAITVLPPAQHQLETHFASRPTDEVRKAYFLSGGLPGLMYGIITDDQEHPLLQQVVAAKELLQKTPYERLALAENLSKQKDALGTLLDALGRIAQSGLVQAGEAANNKQIAQWHTLQKEVSDAKDALAKSANSKLVLTNLFLNF